MTKKKPALPPLAVIPSRAVSDTRLSKTDWRVLAALCARRNKKTKFCFPSIDTIANDVGIDRRHVKRSRNRLKKLGYIDWNREGVGPRASCRYLIFGLTDNDLGGAGFDKMGAGSAPSNGGNSRPPNIEGNIEYNNIPYKHRASFDKAASKNSKNRTSVLRSTVVGNFHKQASILERRIKKTGVSAIILDDLHDLWDAAMDAPDNEREHVTRVFEDAVLSAPEELKPYWAREDEGTPTDTATARNVLSERLGDDGWKILMGIPSNVADDLVRKQADGTLSREELSLAKG